MGFADRAVRGIVVLGSTVPGVLPVLVAFPSSPVMSAVLDRRLPLSWFHVNTLVQVEPLLQTFVPGLFFLPLLAVPMAWAVLPRKNLVGGARQIG